MLLLLHHLIQDVADRILLLLLIGIVGCSRILILVGRILLFLVLLLLILLVLLLLTGDRAYDSAEAIVIVVVAGLVLAQDRPQDSAGQ